MVPAMAIVPAMVPAASSWNLSNNNSRLGFGGLMFVVESVQAEYSAVVKIFGGRESIKVLVEIVLILCIYTNRTREKQKMDVRRRSWTGKKWCK